MKFERRQIEVRVTPNTDGPAVDGIPTQFWARVLNYGVLDDYGTKFRPGAFTESLNRRLPRLMYGHAGWSNPDALLGKGIAFRDSAEGLDVLFEFDDFEFVPRAKQIAYQIKSGTLDEFSIGFVRQKDSRDAGDSAVWIDKGRLGEVSTVVEGSVPNTHVLSMRAALGAAGATVPVDEVVKIVAAMALGQVELVDALQQLKDLGTPPPSPPAEGDPVDPPAPAAGDPGAPPAPGTEPPAVGDGTPPEPPAPPAPDPDPEPYIDEEAEAIINGALAVLTERSTPEPEIRGDKAGHKFHGNQWTGSPKPGNNLKKKKRKPQPAQARMAAQRAMSANVETRAAVGSGQDGSSTMDVTLIHPHFTYAGRFHEDGTLDHGHVTHMTTDRVAQHMTNQRIAEFHGILERQPTMTEDTHSSAGAPHRHITETHRKHAKDITNRLH